MTVYTQYYFALVPGEEHSGYTIIYSTKQSLRYFKYPPGTTPSYCNIINYSPYAVL